MKLYHGTSWDRWQSIQTEGLLPRGMCGGSNWDHSIESNPNTVYFSTAYAYYFGLNALSEDSQVRKIVLIEVDTDSLDSSLLVPDEDVLEQMNRGSPISNKEMIFRTREYRDEILFWASEGFDWLWSVRNMGTCGYHGAISPDQFSRVVVVDLAEESALTWMFLDCSVSVLNFRFLGPRNVNIHRALFGDPPLFMEQDYNRLFPVPAMGKGVSLLNFQGA